MGFDISWEQRSSFYNKAFRELQEAVCLSRTRPLSVLEKRGTIQYFKYVHDLAWKTLKCFLEARGCGDLFSPEEVTRIAFKLGILSDGAIWMDMIKSHRQIYNLCDEKVVEETAGLIFREYVFAFERLNRKLSNLKTIKDSF
jgi:nucleotidyltransferase substrate binding protein (TIGR01987 family)